MYEYKYQPFAGTKEEYDELDSDGRFNCPVCGLRLTMTQPGCNCPIAVGSSGYSYTRHINKYHHDCKDAWERAYGK